MATTTAELDRVMYHHPITARWYGGTWALDEAVTMLTDFNVRRNVCFIINSCPSNHIGSHWTAVWIGEGRAEHFCSYGLPPPLALHNALGDYKRNIIQLQSFDSDLCGYYCMLYLLCRCRGVDLEEYVGKFTNNTMVNDMIVARVMKL